ncbi:unnamed protein product [Parascedosporium putredinis]|uniref:Exonuclease V n=1 Tax=Parascedosporium putredinis TaxID=1442378 RepID=A0A9P1M962_9PEZI|nr:unnamed protein product [Parascedosporium putredinis]CAI7995098.1 unnamed protein product [Parascedosporium putredinis]
MTTLTAPSFDDYYDLTSDEEALLVDLASKIAPAPPVKAVLSTTTSVSVQSSSASATIAQGHVARKYESACVSSVSVSTTATASNLEQFPGAFPASQEQTQPQKDGVVYPDLTRILATLPVQKDPEPQKERTAPKQEKSDDSDIEELGARDLFRDERSPLLRFRTFPKKPFSKNQDGHHETGIEGSQKLEDQVHTTVRIDVDTKEDLFGLKLWNFIQGLRTLRDTGLTRELEVWGMIDGHLCTGIIDSLSYSCPNSDFEEEVISSSQESCQDNGAAKVRQTSSRIVYLCDVKTRGKPYPPKGSAMLRPVKIQLFLYYRFLAEMIKGNLDFFRVFRRLNVDPDEDFSDEFIAQVGGLHDEVFYDADPDSSQESNDGGDGPSSDLIKYRTLRELLPLLWEEVRLTFSDGVDSLGLLLSVDYRFRDDGSIIGSYTFPMDDKALDLHIAADMQWWKGERQPVGVDIEDAFKCRFCEFRDNCSWTARINEERLVKAREKIRNGGGGGHSYY